MIRGKRLSFILFALVLAGSVVLFPGCAHQSTTTTRASLFEPDISAFLREDVAQPPPKGAILFIGSSIFRRWTHLREQMDPLPVFNRAFGGSRTDDVLRYMDKIVFPYEPRIIVYYCGSNDINAGEKPTAIYERIRLFFERAREKLPAIQMYFVSINRAPQKRDRWDIVDSTNALVKEYCVQGKGLGFIDVNPVLFDKDKQPRMDLYLSDQLHLKDQAYEEFTKVIKPVIERSWLPEMNSHKERN
jgi:hypothetical protein